MCARRRRRLRVQFTLRTLLALVTLWAIVCSWLKLSLTGAWRERQAATFVEGNGGAVVRRPAPWWNARRWVGLAFGRDRWSLVDEVWCGYRNNQNVNELPKSGVWPGPLIAKAIPLFGAYMGPYGRDSQPWALALPGSDCLRSFPSARRVGLIAISDDQLSQLVCMHGLRDLELCDTTILGDGLGNLARMPELRRLQLFDAPLSAKGKDQLAGLSNLEELVVWDDGLYERLPDFQLNRDTADTFDDELLARLGALKNLKTLRFCTCSPRLTVTGMAHLADIPSLKTVAIGVRPDHGDDYPNVEDGLARLESLENLQDLTLYGPGFGDRAMEHVARLPSLLRLELCQTRVSKVGLARLADLRALRVLSLRGAHMGEHVWREVDGYYRVTYVTVLKALKSLDNLEELTVDGDEITEAAVPYLQQMKKLAKLRVNGLATWPMSDGLREQLKNALPNAVIETFEFEER